MPAFIMLTRLNPDAVRSPRDLEQLERDAMKRVRQECPDVEWLSSYAVLGPCDYLDIFIANDIETAARVSALIRTFGHAQTEIDRLRSGIGLRRPCARCPDLSDHVMARAKSADGTLALTFLGTRGEIDIRTRRHKQHSSFLVQRGNARIMIDCGADWLGLVQRLAQTSVMLTHAHAITRRDLRRAFHVRFMQPGRHGMRSATFPFANDACCR